MKISHGYVDQIDLLITVDDFIDWAEDYTTYDPDKPTNLRYNMEIPYTFDDNEKPDLDNNSGSKLKPGRYNIEFVRVANSEDKAETIEFNGKTIEGVVTGKNDWKGKN